jgi:hypothetical protein
MLYAFFMVLMSFSTAQAITLESFITDKLYWANFNWGNIYNSRYFTQLHWKKYTREEVASYNLEYGKDKHTGDVNPELLKKHVVTGRVAGVKFEGTVEDKLDQGNMSTSLGLHPTGEKISKNDYDSFIKSMINSYGNTYVKSISRLKFTPVDVLSFESYEWVLKNTILHSTATIFSKTRDEKPEEYMVSISLSNSKISKIMKPDIMLSCEQLISIGKYKQAKTMVIVVEDGPEVQKVRNDNFFEIALKARVTDTSINLTSDGLEATISRLTGNLQGEIYEEKPDEAGAKKQNGTITGKCVKISEAQKAF